VRLPRALLTMSALALLLAAPVWAEDLQVSASAGFAGLGKANQWLPVSVMVTNPGNATTGTLVIPPPANSDSRTEYRFAVDLPKGGRKQFRFYFRPGTEDKVRVRLTTPRATVWGDAPLRLQNNDALIFLVVGAPAGSFAGIAQMSFPPRLGSSADAATRAGAGSTAQVTWAQPEDLPDMPAGYQSVDVVALVSPALDRVTDQQADALRRWVAGGGTLAVFAGPEGANLQVPWLADVLPGSVGPLLTLPSLSGLTRLFGVSPPPVDTGVSALSPRPGSRVLADQNGTALLLWRPYGAGQVTLAAFDPSRRPVEGWAGLDALWQWIGGLAVAQTPLVTLTSQVPESPLGRFGRAFGPPVMNAAPSLPTALRDIPELEPPSFWVILFFLVAYILVLVPLNYAVLRRMDRQELAWVTTPAIVAAFTLLAYGIGFAMRGGEALVSVLTVVERGTDEAEAPALSYVGVFSPSASNYSLALDAEPTAVSEVQFNEESQGPGLPLVIAMSGSRQWVETARMNMWSLRAFEVAGDANLGGPIRATLQLSGDALSGSVANQTRLNLEECRIVARGRSYTVGALKAGETVRLPIASVTTTDTLPARLRVIRDTARNALESEARRTEQPVLIGWARQTPAPVTINNRKYDGEGLLAVVVHVPVALAAGSAPEHRARGWITAQSGAAAFEGDPSGRGGVPSDGSLPLSLGRGDLGLAFAVPELTVDRVRTLTLRISGLQASHTVRVLNRARGTWETPAARTARGAFRTFDLNPRDFLDPGRRTLEVRLSGTGANASLVAEAVYTATP